MQASQTKILFNGLNREMTRKQAIALAKSQTSQTHRKYRAEKCRYWNMEIFDWSETWTVAMYPNEVVI
jgi:hypothetical protein